MNDTISIHLTTSTPGCSPYVIAIATVGHSMGAVMPIAAAILAQNLYMAEGDMPRRSTPQNACGKSR